MNISREIRAAGALTFAACATAGNAPNEGAVRSSNKMNVTTMQSEEFGLVDIYTLAVPDGVIVRTATFTPSGSILVSYANDAMAKPRDIMLATMNADGTGFRHFFQADIPLRPKDNGLRFMMFADKKRIFMGDFVLECTKPLEQCSDARLIDVQYPAEVADGDHVSHRWSEMVIAPDNQSVAWTSLLSNYAAIVFTGQLRREANAYVIASPTIISSINPFLPDPNNADGVLPQPVRGGEVKQFVHGGAAISLAGAARRDIPDSVVQHLSSGKREGITDTPGYTETTIFSPDETLGVVMTTRFSNKTDPAVLGLVPRPYPDSLNMGLSMLAYTYSVTGVRRGRPGNIGPALIAINASKSADKYQGLNLNTDQSWVYRSPMSWHPGGKMAMWQEGQFIGGPERIQIVHLSNYRNASPVAPVATPVSVSYGITDLSVVKAFASQSRDIDVKVYGRASGYIQYKRTPEAIVKTYVDFSDDGKSAYSGRETTMSNPKGISVYTADITLSGQDQGRMDLTISFGPISGEVPATIIFTPNANGVPLSRGYAEYNGRRLNVSDLLP